jgi:hypothetical protein
MREIRGALAHLAPFSNSGFPLGINSPSLIFPGFRHTHLDLVITVKEAPGGLQYIIAVLPEAAGLVEPATLDC